MLAGFVDSPPFYTDTEISSTDINILRNNAMILQGAKQRAQSVHCIDTIFTGFVVGQTIWEGGFQYRTGMEDAVIVYVATIVGSPDVDQRFKIYFNDVEVHSRALTTEVVTITITIDDKGYVDRDCITVVCKLTGDPEVYDATQDTYFINNAQVQPLAGIMTTSYPGTITFGDISATNLNALGNSIDWLADRLSLVPRVPIMSLRNWQGTFQVEQFLIARFLVYVEANNPNLAYDIDFTCRSAQSYVRVVVNGTNFDHGPYTYGQTVPISNAPNLITQAGCVAGNQYYVEIYENLTVEYAEEPKPNSRFNIQRIYMFNTSYSWTAPPTECQMLESISFSTLQSRLNAIKSIVDGVKTRIDDNEYIFNRAQMFRGRYGNDEFQKEYWQGEMIARNVRAGDILWVKGKGLSIGWGAVTVTSRGDQEKYEYEYQYNETLTDGDKIETKFFYFAQFAGLFPAMDYYIYGKDIQFVWEYLR